MSLRQLDRPIAYHRIFVTLTGSVTAAVMLSQAVYWNNRTDDQEGWFYKTQREWEEETGLTRYEQEGARKTLRNLGFWHEKREGVPAQLFFRLDEQVLQSQLDKLAQSSMRKSSNLVSGKTTIKRVEKPQSIIRTETTTETTTEKKEGYASPLRGRLAPPPENLSTASPGRKPKNPTDPRAEHWAIQGIRSLTQRYPMKFLWDDIIQDTGTAPQMDKLKGALKEWVKRGYNAGNTLGWIEWFKNGIPPAKEAQQRPRTQAEMNAAAPGKFVM